MNIDVAFFLLALITSFSSLQGFILLLMARKHKEVTSDGMPGTHRRVSVLIPCFNERKVLRKTLESILTSRRVNIARIICIDDGSTDGTIEVMQDMHRLHGDIIVVLGQTNMGKAAALNHGLTAVDTEFFVSIDADTQVMPDTIADLLVDFDDAAVAAVSGHMLVGNRRPASKVVFGAQVREYELANNIERRAFSKIRRITVVPGAVGAFRSEAVASVGGYPEGTLAEDAHLTMLLLMDGRRAVHRPSALVLTEAPDTLAGLYKQRVRWATGKTQVILRLARPALKQRGSMLLIWSYMAWNHSILPLFSLLGMIFLPASAAAILARGEQSTGAADVAQVAVIAIAVVLVNYLYFWASRRFSHSLDAAGRAAAGLAETPTGFRSTVIIPIVGSVASWVAWHTVITGRRGTWNKLERSGDVRLPADRQPIPAANGE
ncbi:glycosyltransferase [Streptomyces sp. NPDC088725]|uniref:glycosyltransferase n=1 Tax=Streptomyces sp. NPDC088725 TaxID=3365873 RepID=UPI00382064A6